MIRVKIVVSFSVPISRTLKFLAKLVTASLLAFAAHALTDAPSPTPLDEMTKILFIR